MPWDQAPVIVEIDERSLAEFGQWPWPRNLVAQLLQEIRDKGALSVGLDMMFPEPDRTSRVIEYANNSASGVELMEYFRMLDKQMFEGLGIPEELIEAGQTGSGYAGRRVPAQSFFAILQELGEMLLSDVDEQIIRPLVAWNFDDSVDYTVEMLPLAASDVEEDTLPGDEETEGSQGQEGSPIGPPQQNIFQ